MPQLSCTDVDTSSWYHSDILNFSVWSYFAEGVGNNAEISANLGISNAEKLLNQLRQLPSGAYLIWQL